MAPRGVPLRRSGERARYPRTGHLPRAAVRVAAFVGLTVAGAWAAGASTGDSAADAVDAVRACRAERDDERRLACFDAASARLGGVAAPTAGAASGSAITAGGASPATTAPAVTGRAAAVAAMTPEQRFGYRGEVARDAIERQKAELPELDRLESTVKSAAQQATGDFVVTLENGQVWAQLPTGTPQRLKAGDAVTITPASLGSYVLKGPSGRGARVRRVR
jgi:hypothetical protein